jgi:squalene synthase HpnD
MNATTKTSNFKPMEEMDIAAQEHVRQVSMASGSSFLSGIKVLSVERREAMYAIYAFCREVDDIADDPLELAEKRRLLKEWREEIERIFAGHPNSLTGRALATAIAQYGLQKQDLLDLINGMEMDADETATHGPEMAILDQYCDRVASAVGRLSVRVFGDSGDAAQQVATSLGRALQLTNILRDIAEDAERGRLYLPSDLLDRHNISTREPGSVIRQPGLPAVCEDLSQIAKQHYTDAEVAMAACSRKTIRPAVLMMQVYLRVLDGLIKRGWMQLDIAVKVPKSVKIWILLRYGLF